MTYSEHVHVAAQEVWFGAKSVQLANELLGRWLDELESTAPKPEGEGPYRAMLTAVAEINTAATRLSHLLGNFYTVAADHEEDNE